MYYKTPTITTKERLLTAMELRRMKPMELSEKTGIPISSISHYTSGLVEPKQNRIYLMAQALDVSETWLIGYDVPMERTYGYALTASEKELVELYRSLPDGKQQLLLNMAKLALEG